MTVSMLCSKGALSGLADRAGSLTHYILTRRRANTPNKSVEILAIVKPQNGQEDLGHQVSELSDTGDYTLI